MQSFQSIMEIKTNIFKFVDNPLNLALTCRSWSAIAKNPNAKSEWLIEHHGKTCALFHAVRLGPNFIDIDVCNALFERNVIISRYFIQKLLMHFGTYDPKLIEFKTEHNVGQSDRLNEPSWGKDLPLSVFNHLLSKGYDNANEDSSIRSRHEELFKTYNIGDRPDEQHLNEIDPHFR